MAENATCLFLILFLGILTCLSCCCTDNSACITSNNTTHHSARIPGNDAADNCSFDDFLSGFLRCFFLKFCLGSVRHAGDAASGVDLVNSVAKFLGSFYTLYKVGHNFTEAFPQTAHTGQDYKEQGRIKRR